MIQYSLRCAEDHSFDSWFHSAAAFDKLADARMVTCAVCGSTEVEKAVMAPRVGRSHAGETPAPAPARGALSQPLNPAEQAMARLRKHVETTSDYVGDRFAAEARAIHDGEAPERSIHGEAKPEDARRLVEDGIPVAPLPFTPRAKSN